MRKASEQKQKLNKLSLYKLRHQNKYWQKPLQHNQCHSLIDKKTNKKLNRNPKNGNVK